MHTLSIRELAARYNLAHRILAAKLLDLKDNESVINEYFISDTELVYKVVVGHRNPGFVTYYVLGRKGESVTVVEGDFFILKGLYAIFGTLCIKHYCDRQAELFTDTLHKVHLLPMLFVRTV